jgi:hypothetical protein
METPRTRCATAYGDWNTHEIDGSPMASGSKNQTGLRIGFLTAIEIGDGGFVGGLLVADRFGRPLEFQCTTPVKPNRTQSLLYGPTLVPFILGELLAKTLIERVGIKPDVILTNREEILEVRRLVDQIVLLAVVGREQSPGDSTLKVGSQLFQTHADFPDDVEAARRQTAVVSRESDLHEPLERVGEALSETLGTASQRPRVA